MEWGIKIPLHDGIRLSSILYMPRNRPSSLPAIFTMSPYVAQSHHAAGMYFAAHGYAFLAVDVRGRGDSEGEFHPLTDASDGEDVIKWLAQQAFCSGQIAMWGGSYLGRCQWMTAAKRPSDLATIVPVAAPFYGVDVPLRNNVFELYTVRWLMLLAGRTLQDKLFGDREYWATRFREWFKSGLPFKNLDSFVGNYSPLFQEWIAHPELGTYWDKYNPTPEQYSELSIPILTITGAYDGDQLGALEHYRRHTTNAKAAGRARHFLIIGPWDHHGTSAPQAEFCGLKVGPKSLLDLRKLHLDWYAWTMRGGPKPEFLRKNVAYYVTGSETWRYAETLEEITAHSVPLYLQSSNNPTEVFASGHLVAEFPTATGRPAEYVHDPRESSHGDIEVNFDVESLVDQEMVHSRIGKQLIYHSDPFTEDRQVSGFFKLLAWIFIDQLDTDFIVSVHDVSTDGTSVLLSTDWVRARYRVDRRRATLVDTKTPLLYTFEHFMFVARVVRRGHRLRLVVGPSDWVEHQRNYNGGGVVSDESIGDARSVNVRLFQDAAHPSALHVPFGSLVD